MVTKKMLTLVSDIDVFDLLHHPRMVVSIEMAIPIHSIHDHCLHRQELHRSRVDIVDHHVHVCVEVHTKHKYKSSLRLFNNKYNYFNAFLFTHLS